MTRMSAINPENGTVSYTYNPTTNTLASKTDAKSQKLTYQYDGYNRLTSVTWSNAPGGSKVLRSYMYDSNTLDTSFSGSYTQGRLVAVQNAQFTPGNGALVSWTQLVEMYGYVQAGGVSGKRLQVNEHVPYPLGGGQTLTRNLDAAYTYNSEGQVASVNYPTTWTYNSGGVAQSANGSTYTHAFDGMARLSGMTDQNHNTDVSNATYDAGNRLLSLNYPIGGETRQYNTLGQLTQISWNIDAYINYNYPTGTNNGKISSTYSASGEGVTYAYDSLNRLLSASSSSGWAETYGYDGYGNLLSKTPTAGTPPSLSQAVNPANNQIVGQGYDANGNQGTAPGFVGGATFDVENRIVAAPGIQYAYDSQNKRVWSGTVDSINNLNLQSVYFYGINGKRIGTYSLNVSYGSGQYTEIADPPANLITYFGSKRLDITEDRLGSNFGIALYPWGEDRTGQPNDQTKFATYTRDSATLLDYANNRYYTNAYGRFMTPDPYTAGGRGSGNPSDPQSWNRYAYTRGDPVNRFDPNGTDDSGAGDGGASGDLSGGDTSSFTCDTSWESDASLVGTPCGIQVPGPYGGMVYINVAAIAAAAIAAAQTAAQTAQTNCENTETAWLSNYLSQRGSPLAAFAGSIVSQSDAAGIDDRFIVALAGAESTYGKNTSATWGQYNAWSDSQHCAIKSGDCQAVNPFSSWSQAISAAIGNITGKNYFGANPSLTTTDSIYKRYSNGASPSLLNTIYLNQMGGGLIPGNPKEVDFARCP